MERKPNPARKADLLALLAKLRKEARDDQESAHMDADLALLDYLADPEIRDAFLAIPKWYA